MHFEKRSLGLVVLLALLTPAGWAGQDKRFTVEDTLALKSVGNIRWMPDGGQVLFTVREWDREENRFLSHIYLVGLDGEPPVQLTRGEKGESNPRPSPDGRALAFLANRDGEKGKNQIWLLPLQGGEAYKLTDEENSVSGFEWAPDSRRIAFTTREVPDDKEEREKRKKEKFDAVVVDTDFKWTHLWVVGVEDKEKRRLTESGYNVGQVNWSPAGDRLVQAR